jgi:hypothetical protein
MSLKSLSNNLELGSSPRSSTGIYNKTASLFSPNKSSASRLLSVPMKSASDNTLSSAVSDMLPNSNASISNASTQGGISFWRYLIVFLILVFLSINLVLFLIKPTNVDITHLYDPLFTFSDTHFNTNFGSKIKTPEITPAVTTPTVTTKAKNNSALNKIEKALEIKPAINKIDGGTSAAGTSAAGTSAAGTTQASNLMTPVKNYKKLPVIPEVDDSTSRIQMKPTSKAGFCYIGEDRGFRSCIDVGEGDVCMSGDIFPTEAICINPNLRA